MQDRIDEFHRLGAEAFGISVDSRFALAAWARERGFTFPLLSDLNREAMTAFGVKLDEFVGYRGVANRAIFVIDRDGTIIYQQEKTPEQSIPDVEGALRALREIV